MNKNNATTAFTRYGPILGTVIIVISFHMLIYLDHPTRFLQSLITPSVVIPMFFFMLIAIVVGYIIGYIPAYITGELFLHLFQNKLARASLYQIIAYGCFSGLLWAPLLFLLVQFSQQSLLPFLYLQFILILPITIICAMIEWKKLK
ncbi:MULTISPECIES: hypothetical protein [Acinetobacter]|uniref:hypothetical protein n=1 Tax=Acinetobacter TaxID=469 RepID=UPI000BDF9647|nr:MULTISPECIES: hypothetical protein [Acinetobacter]